MEQFYFGLSKNTLQSANIVFTGGILRSSYNQIKNMLDTMASNSQEWRDESFGSRNDSRGTKGNRGRIEDGIDRSIMVALQG